MERVSASADRSPLWKWWICGLLLCASAINYLDRQTLANAAVRITREFTLSQEQYGNLEFAFGLAFAAGSLLFGFLADRIPVRWLYPAVVLLWSGIGFATAYSTDYHGLLLCRTFLGLIEAGHWPCAVKTTQRLLAREDRTMGNSVLQSGTSIGAILTPLIMNALLTSELGSWRLPFQIIGGIGLIWILSWWLLLRGYDFQSAPSPTFAAGQIDEVRLSRVVLNRRFLALVIVIVLINICWQLLRAWLPKILQEGRGYGESDALYFNALYFVATDLGCLGAGAMTLWLNRRGLSVDRSRRLVFLGCALLTTLTTVAAFLPKGWLLLFVLLLVGAGALGLFPCYYALSQELSSTHQGMVTGLTGVFAWALSAPVHKFFGRLVDQTGSFDLGVALVGWTPLIAFFALVLLWNSKEPHSQ